VREGQPLLEISDLSRIWVLFDAYESDLAWIRKGMTLRFTVAGQPGKEYSGKVSFIDPVIDPMSRVARVRVEMPNPDGTLKPEMFATGVVKSMLAGESEHLVIPKTAVLWTGKRSVVWVRDMESEAPVFEYREVRLGSEAGDSYVIEEGLMEGEHVVANGVFSIDAAAQLQGKASMMNPSGGPAPSGHNHGGNTGRTTVAPASSSVPSAFRVQLHALFKSYEKISSALIASDAAAIPASVGSVRNALDNVKASLLTGETKVHWAVLRNEMRRQLDSLRGTRDLEKQRSIYSGLGSTLLGALTHFGVEGESVYSAFCPMAFDDKGAYWLTSSKDIRNPYYGDAMLKCGVIKGEVGGGTR
jgi:Cu(I)/Ag(I) efflux system membrane fusion protein